MARSFTAASSHRIDCTDINAIDGIANLSISLWIRRTADALMAFCSKSNAAGTQGWILQNVSAGLPADVRLYFGTGSPPNGQTSSALLTLNTLCHVGVAYAGAGGSDAAKLKIYVNGVNQTLSFTGTLPTTLVTTATNFKIGGWEGGTAYVSGDLAECGLWSATLAADEFAALAKGVLPHRIRKSNLVGYWPLWGIHSTEPDIHLGTYPGTLTGTARANHPPVSPFTRQIPSIFEIVTAPSATFDPSYTFIAG